MSDLPDKICNKCHIPKKFRDFYVNISTKDGYSYSCKECEKAYQLVYKKKKRADPIFKLEENKRDLIRYHKNKNKKIMKQYNSSKFNVSAIFDQDKTKLVPIIEIVFLVEEPNWVNNEEQKVIERKIKASEIRMSMGREQLVKLQNDLTYAIENIDSMQKVCDTAVIEKKEITTEKK